MPHNMNKGDSARMQNTEDHCFPNTAHPGTLFSENKGSIRYWYSKKLKKAICFFDVENTDVLDLWRGDATFPHDVTEISAESFARMAKQLETLNNHGGKDQVGVVLCRRISPQPIELEESKRFKELMSEFNQKTKDLVLNSGGVGPVALDDYMHVRFDNLKMALECALQLRQLFMQCRKKISTCKISINIGLSPDLAERAKLHAAEESVKSARRLSYMNGDLIVLSNQLSDNRSALRAEKFIRILNYQQEKFLHKLMDCLEKHWQDENFQVEDIGNQLNCSKSKIYRQMMDLLGKSPNQFIKEYRLNRAIDLIRAQRRNISEIAFESGFGSPSYFSRCFQKRFGLNPSDFIATME